MSGRVKIIDSYGSTTPPLKTQHRNKYNSLLFSLYYVNLKVETAWAINYIGPWNPIRTGSEAPTQDRYR